MMINFLYLAAFLFLFLLFIIVISLRFQISCKFAKTKITIKQAIEATMLSVFINLIFPFKMAGVFVKPFFLKKFGHIDYEKSISGVFVEQIFDNIPQLFIVLISVYFYSQANISMTKNALLLLALAVIIFLIFYSKFTIKVIDKFLKIINIFPKKIKLFIRKKSPIKHKKIINVLNIIQKSPSKNFNLGIMTLITVIIAFHFPLIQYFFFKAILIETTYFQMFVVYWIPFFIGKVSGIPSGLGVREAAMTGILVSYGVPIEKAIFASIAFRIVITTLNAILGVLVTIKYGIKIKDLRKRKQTTISSQ